MLSTAAPNQTPAGSVAATSVVQAAIVVPIYKHSGLLLEAVESALAQSTDVTTAIVLVNDGCPFQETDAICRRYQVASPERIYYVRKANGGLSSARNAGIDFALAAFPALEFVYLLDADNRIAPTLLARSMEVLRNSEPEVGWAYPDINKFGVEEFSDTSGPYNPFEHLVWNFCEAGSLVRRSVFDAGLRYDEQMLKGYEDWEFWLQCVTAGFRGRHVPASGFQYRQRAESMLKNAEREHGVLLEYVRDKHKALYDLPRFVAAEHEHAPRYAHIDEAERVRCFSDPSLPMREQSLASLVEAAARNAVRPEMGAVPPACVLATRTCMDMLNRTGLLPGVLWSMSRAASDSGVALCCLRTLDGAGIRIGFESSSEASDVDTAILVLASRDALFAHATHAGCRIEAAATASFTLSLSAGCGIPNDVHIDTTRCFEQVREAVEAHSETARYDFYPAWPQSFRRSRHEPVQYFSDLHSLAPVLPITRRAERPNVGFILPIVQFGGVEKVAFNYADVLRRAGYGTHLFIVGGREAVIAPWFASTFDTVTFFDDSPLDHFVGSPVNDYFGARSPLWVQAGDTSGAVAMLATMDAVINFHVDAFNAVMGDLRRRAVMTYSSQHLVDITPFGQPDGPPHQLLAYEHAFDGVLSISRQMCAWLHANGVPSDKVLHLPNAPSYPIDEAEISRAIAARPQRDGDPLRVLFIGRFDRQKGLDRLVRLVRWTDAAPVDVKWRIVGKAVLDDEQEGALAELAQHLHPPAVDVETLNAHFAWADALVLLSRFEGVPLTILEAGRLGCIPLATRVGAVNEAIDDGKCGFIFDESVSVDELVEQVGKRLLQLACERKATLRTATAAARYYGSLDWHQSLEPLLARLKPLQGRNR